MKEIKNALRLNKKIVCYIPATIGTAAAADNSSQVNRAGEMLSGLFGGATIQPGRGCWLSDSSGLVTEETTLVYAFTDPASLEEKIDSVIDFMEALKIEMRQEAVSLEIDGVLYIF